MEASSTLTVLNNGNNGKKTRVNDIVFQDMRLELPPYRPRLGSECLTQGGIPVIDLTVDTPSQSDHDPVENYGSNDLWNGRVIDVDSLPDRHSSSRHLDVYQTFPFESIDLDDILLLNHSISQSSRNCHIHSFPPTRRVTRQTTNQMRLWENQFFQTNDSFLHALINHMTPLNTRRANTSVRYSRTYPYYLSSRQNFSTTPIEYNLFTDHSNINAFSKKDTSITPHLLKGAPDAMKGFTRSLNKSQKLVCPNCIDELGVSDDFVKRSIWMGKCGHIYCGDCAKLFKSMKSKGPHSAICPVKHCNKVITGNHNLREIYV
ncbi:hypothetical protein PNEG_01577 [Pneumocystis murina B123]|uniref:RING-type domain-containing protein n=1 Tax=Pneumocystis murina (strain B123) TaxID=1069680 RepID=M7NTB8_PNEMU|nr:hypothetical protein PNEG_01577 [Pneumocystis murina B123]EMR10321.1 hypothetical protein PNEG_01577 [Pneumocystis murina B123]